MSIHPIKTMMALARWVLRKPAGRSEIIRCWACHRIHVDMGFWVYRAHVKHLCHYCGEIIQPYGRGNMPITHPTRGIMTATMASILRQNGQWGSR